MRPLRLWQVNAHYTIMQSVGDRVTRPRLLAAMCLPRGGSANYSWQACLWRAESRGCKIEAPWGPWIWSSLDLDMVKPAPGYGQAWTWIWSSLHLDMVRPGPGYGQPWTWIWSAWTWIGSGLDLDMVSMDLDTVSLDLDMVRPGPGYRQAWARIWSRSMWPGKGEALNLSCKVLFCSLLE